MSLIPPQPHEKWHKKPSFPFPASSPEENPRTKNWRQRWRCYCSGGMILKFHLFSVYRNCYIWYPCLDLCHLTLAGVWNSTFASRSWFDFKDFIYGIPRSHPPAGLWKVCPAERSECNSSSSFCSAIGNRFWIIH